MMTATQVVAAGPQGPATELTGTSEYFRWQHELILYGLVVAFSALFAADGSASNGGCGVLGDGHNLAPVVVDGRVDWWAVPRLDVTPALIAVSARQRARG